MHALSVDLIWPALGRALAVRSGRALALGLSLLGLLTACGGGGPTAVNVDAVAAGATPSTSASVPLAAPAWPRASIAADELAVVAIAGNALSEAMAESYRRLHDIPAENLIRLNLPTGGALVSEADFKRAKAQFDAQVPPRAQATLLAFAQPSRVVGSHCSMSITSAMALGYDAAWCGGCAATKASPYYDSETTHPWDDLKMRPAMMLPASTLGEAQAWMARGLAATTPATPARALLVRTTDAARSVRYKDMLATEAVWRADGGVAVQYLDASNGEATAAVDSGGPLMFHFTGATWIADKGSRWWPGAVADHLTSYAGMLPDANGQMPATDWLRAGATASYGSVEEPCNFQEKFPRVSVLIDHYLRGATVIEAYWKAVAWPGQGLFIGDPLARPFADTPLTKISIDGVLTLRTRAWRRGAAYELQWRASAAESWSTVHRLAAGAPVPTELQLPLPATTGELRWTGPCTTGGTGCVIATSN